MVHPWISFNEFQPETLSTNPAVLYDDAKHRYSHGKVIYTSATQLLDQFKPKFDTVERSTYMADRYGKDPAYWVQKWDNIRDESLERGTAIHNRREQLLYSEKLSWVPDKGAALKVQRAIDYSKMAYIDYPDGIYPELLLWNHKFKIAGRADKVIITTEQIKEVAPGHVVWKFERYADVEDYKTGRIIHTQSFKDASGYRMMNWPLSHLQDCEMVHYTLQLSIYQFMLEMMGFKPGKRRIIHIKHEIPDLGIPEPVVHELPYLKNEVISMIKYINAKRIKNVA